MTSTAAVLLRSTPYGEADVVVTLLGRTTGRVSAVAKGARKSQRRFSGGLGLGALGEAVFRDRSGADLMMLDSFEVLAARMGLGAELGRTAHAAYALELCDRLCAPRHPEPDVFLWLDEFLQRLEVGAPSLGRIRTFELGLLQRLGIGPVLDGCARCGQTDLDAEPARWLAEHGGLHCRGCARTGMLLPPEARRALDRLRRCTLEEAERVTLAREVNAICREAILELMRHHAPGPLKSLEFIQKLGA